LFALSFYFFSSQQQNSFEITRFFMVADKLENAAQQGVFEREEKQQT